MRVDSSGSKNVSCKEQRVCLDAHTTDLEKKTVDPLWLKGGSVGTIKMLSTKMVATCVALHWHGCIQISACANARAHISPGMMGALGIAGNTRTPHHTMRGGGPAHTQ